MSITEFLAARFAEDEATVTSGDCRCDDTPPRRPDCPDRIYAEVELKRRVLARHAPYHLVGYEDEDPICDYCQGCPDWPCADVLDVASVYFDHPDFDPAWRLEETA